MHRANERAIWRKLPRVSPGEWMQPQSPSFWMSSLASAGHNLSSCSGGLGAWDRISLMNSAARTRCWINESNQVGCVTLAVQASVPRCEDVRPSGRMACARSTKRDSKTEVPVVSKGVLKSSMVQSFTGLDSTPSRSSRAAGDGNDWRWCWVYPRMLGKNTSLSPMVATGGWSSADL